MTHTLPRRLCGGLLLLAITLASAACKKQNAEATHMQSMLSMSDAKIEPQLVKGFHGIEAGAWRWTEKQFTVVLRPPFGAGQKGAKLSVNLTAPQAVSLSATAAGSALPPETYTTPGKYSYVRQIPASLLTGDSLRVDFHLDKAIVPNGGDVRELGIIVASVGLESK